MSKIFEDNSLTIGHTPLVRLNRIGNGRISWRRWNLVTPASALSAVSVPT